RPALERCRHRNRSLERRPARRIRHRPTGHAAMRAEIDTIRAAVARGWCAPQNSHKVMDPDLAEAIAQEVLAAIAQGVGEDRAPAVWWRHCIANGEWHRHDGRTHLAVLMLDGADLSSKGSREDAMRSLLVALTPQQDTPAKQEDGNG